MGGIFCFIFPTAGDMGDNIWAEKACLICESLGHFERFLQEVGGHINAVHFFINCFEMLFNYCMQDTSITYTFSC